VAGAAAGYSGKTLADKLGLKPGARLWLLNPPSHYQDLVGPLPVGGELVDEIEAADVVHAFVRDRAMLASEAAWLTSMPRPGAILWISWAKKSSRLFVDLTENGVREILLPTGWVDVKVCAVDDDWSGLKFLRRKS
jgi:hypothetical protein